MESTPLRQLKTSLSRNFNSPRWNSHSSRPTSIPIDAPSPVKAPYHNFARHLRNENVNPVPLPARERVPSLSPLVSSQLFTPPNPGSPPDHSSSSESATNSSPLSIPLINGHNIPNPCPKLFHSVAVQANEPKLSQASLMQSLIYWLFLPKTSNDERMQYNTRSKTATYSVLVYLNTAVHYILGVSQFLIVTAAYIVLLMLNTCIVRPVRWMRDHILSALLILLILLLLVLFIAVISNNNQKYQSKSYGTINDIIVSQPQMPQSASSVPMIDITTTPIISQPQKSQPETIVTDSDTPTLLIPRTLDQLSAIRNEMNDFSSAVSEISASMKMPVETFDKEIALLITNQVERVIDEIQQNVTDSTILKSILETFPSRNKPNQPNPNPLENMTRWVNPIRDFPYTTTTSNSVELYDYASIPTGGRVQLNETSRTYTFPLTSSAYINNLVPAWVLPPMVRPRVQSHGPNWALIPSSELGMCWATSIADLPITLTVQLSRPICPSAISITHPLSTYPSAPYQFEVYGLKSKDMTWRRVLVQYGVYRIPDQISDERQVFTIEPNEVECLVDRVQLVIQSNHGHVDYTCLYRFEVLAPFAMKCSST